MLESLKKEVYEANMDLPKYDLIKFTWGNVSGIDRAGGYVVIKPSGVPYEDLTPEKMVVVDMEGNPVEGSLHPSSDLPTHLELYRAFPEIGGVVHAHSTYATAFAQAKTPVRAYGTTHADVFYGDVPCTRELTDAEIETDYEANTGKVIAQTFADLDYAAIPGVLVSCHGPFTWAKTPAKAVENMAVLEECARMNSITLLANPGVPTIGQAILDKHYFRKHGKNAYYGQAENPFDKLLRGRDDCPCGRKHSVLLKEIVFEKNAYLQAKRVISAYTESGKVTMVCDENTYKAAGQALAAQYPFYDTVILRAEGLHANDDAVAELDRRLKPDTDLLVAVGGGTVHDITRYVGHRRDLNFISVPTAPSVDGFTSGVASMTFGGTKVTSTARAPIAMLADTEVLRNAPMRLIASGVGDLLGKYTSLLDWKVAHILTGEHICDYIISLQEDVLSTLVSNMDGLCQRDESCINNLFYGLVLSGLAMQMYGSSRPASGAEHHISHFIEMEVINGTVDYYHGEKVGVGFAMVCDRYKTLLSMKAPRVAASYSFPESEIRTVYGKLCERIAKENENDCLSQVDLTRIPACFEEIQALVQTLPTGDEVRQMLRKVGAPATLTDLGLPETDAETICRYSPYVRNRLTLMRTMRVLTAQ